MSNEACCDGKSSLRVIAPAQPKASRFNLLAQGVIGIIALSIWWILYTHLERAANWLVFGLLHLSKATRLGSATQFFVFETPKILMLLTIVVFGVGIVRSFFTPERTRTGVPFKPSVGLSGAVQQK